MTAIRAGRPLGALLALALAGSVAAQGQFGIESLPGGRIAAPGELLGTWGTAAQCATDEAPSPYRIEPEWIEQNGIYCYLAWQAHHGDDGRSETLALAQCGEDSLREYRVFLLLDADRLRIRWSDSFTTPALARCR